jgi:hypothetical protein
VLEAGVRQRDVAGAWSADVTFVSRIYLLGYSRYLVLVTYLP